MRQSIQEWTKNNLWKTVFEKIEVIWHLVIWSFKNLNGPSKTWSILEYFVSYISKIETVLV